MNYKALYIYYIFVVSLFACMSSESTGVAKIIPLILIAIQVIIVFIFDYKSLFQSFLKTKYVFALVILIITGIFRSNIPHQTIYQIYVKASSILLIYINTSHLLYVLLKRKQDRKAINMLILPFFNLGLLNIIFFLFGIIKETIIAKDSSILMELIGFNDFPRINFFLVDGVNSYGSLNGLCLMIVIISYYLNFYNRITTLSLLIIFTTVAFVTDSRGAFVYTIFGLIISNYFSKSKNLSLLKLIPPFSVAAPVLLGLFLPLLAANNIFSFMSRSANDFSSGNSRFYMWDLIFNDIIINNDVSFFGFGDGGIYATHSVSFIVEIFKQYEGVVVNPQNSLIALILDYGILAFVLLNIILFKSINRLKKFSYHNLNLSIVASCSLIYLMLISVTEAVIAMYYQNSFLVFIYVFCLPFCLPNNKRLIIG